MKHRARRNPRRGNAFIEMAFVLLPFFTLMFGIVDFSMILYLRHTFQNAVNAATRFGVTYNTSFTSSKGVTVACATQTECIKAVIYDNTNGLITSTNHVNSKGAEEVWVDWYTPDNLSRPASTTPVNKTGNVLEVRIDNYLWSWIMPMWAFLGNGGQNPGQVSISAYSSDVMQSLPVGQLIYPTAK